MDESQLDQFERDFPCAARADWIRNHGRFFCRHPRVHVRDQIVSANVCRQCVSRTTVNIASQRPYPTLNLVNRSGPCFHLGGQTGERKCETCQGEVRQKVFACLHPEHSETTVKDCDRCGDYDHKLQVGEVSEWAVGITSAPRKPSTLFETISSIRDAGWDDLVLFAEPETLTDGLGGSIEVVRRSAKLGAWPNWILSLAELFLRKPQADAYVLFQDDVILCRNVREYLEMSLWPRERLAFVSLYCSSGYDGKGERYATPSGVDGYIGALALVFPPQAVRALLSSGLAWAHRLRPGTGGVNGVDFAIGRWAAKEDLDGLFHSPSLAQHIGDASTVWPDGRNAGRRKADTFVGRDFDACELVHSGPTPSHAPSPKLVQISI